MSDKRELVYFGMQGRAGMIRHALAAKGEDYTDTHVTGDEWKEIKDVKYGKGVGLPVLILQDGTILNQSVAILKMVCHEAGFVPKTELEAYSEKWYFDEYAAWMAADGSMKAIFNGEADAAAIDKTAEIFAGHW